MTPDHVNPEAPWPELERLGAATAAAGSSCCRGSPSTREYLRDPALARRRRARRDARGVRRASVSAPRGVVHRRVRRHAAVVVAAPPRRRLAASRRWRRRPGRRRPTALLSARGPEVDAAARPPTRCGPSATATRSPTSSAGTSTTPTSATSSAASARSRRASWPRTCAAPPYLLGRDEILRRCHEAWERGGTEVCLQGGIHPGFTGEWYIELVEAIRAELPDLHIHAFSPLEVWQGATRRDAAARLPGAPARRRARLAAGHGGRDPRRRRARTLCPDKVSTSQWLEVMRTAHSLGIRTTSTIMFGHIEQPVHQANHLLALRDLRATRAASPSSCRCRSCTPRRRSA